jgi:gamma-glutamyltranspeptidase/glutathione hydrolase
VSRHFVSFVTVSMLAALASSCGTRQDREPQTLDRPGNVELTTFPTEWSYRPGAEAPFAPQGMVASNCALATKAGIEILQSGGNAVDAAVAVGFALAVAYPEAGNIGGGGYTVLRMSDGRTAALDFRETAPAAASHDMYVGTDGKPTDASLVGQKASGVPGSVAGQLALLEKYGTLTRRRVMEPAIRLAREGLSVDAILRTSIEQNAKLIARFAGAALFLPDGKPPETGARLTQPDLARTLERISEEGSAGFYRGPVAAAVVAEMKRGGGIITAEDLAGYQPVWRTPLTGSYRGHSLIAMPPSSSGGITVLESLNILETWPEAAPWGSAAALHRLAGAFQRAFIDRNNALGDPDFVAMPLQLLAGKDYARRLRGEISEEHAIPTLRIRPLPEGSQTTNYAVVDRWGNAVDTTTTINSLYGSGVWVPDAGFFLNNEMDDFTVQPGAPNQFGLVQGEANAIAPGKRMLSAMAPTIVLDPEGRVLLVIGGRGGPRIITSVVQAIVNVIDYQMTLADALGAPRIHHQALPDVLQYEKGGVPAEVVEALEAMGYETRAGATGSLTAIMRSARGWQGMYDPRGHGLAAGY